MITREDGVVLKVSDLGKVKDEFVDTTSISRINGKPGLAIDVNAASREDLLAMADSVKEYVKEKQLPAGYSFAIWGDSSIEVRGPTRSAGAKRHAGIDSGLCDSVAVFGSQARVLGRDGYSHFAARSVCRTLAVRSDAEYAVTVLRS